MEDVFTEIESKLRNQGFLLEDKHILKPWGGYYCVKKEQSNKFIMHFFSELVQTDLKNSSCISPKILVIAPGKRLSWQYHLRRSEIWKVIQGEIEVVTSNTNVEESANILTEGGIIKLEKEKRHRIVGLDKWSIVAEVWQHCYDDNLSDENDIIRVQDDFGRN